jgi:TP901 family phage tail tape measure protein
MAEEILGISGQMDISDIQSSLDKLCDSLTRVGVDTDALSSRMTKALNDIAKSDDDLATKTQQAMQTLKSAMDEASKGIQNVPDMIDNANKRVETIEGTISKLNEKLAETEKGTGAFDALTKQLDAQKQSLQLAKEDVVELSNSYNTVKNSISEVSGAYQALGALSTATTGANSAQSVANAAVVASASTAAAAVTAEAGANTASTAAAIANTAAKGENAQATQQLTESLREYMSVAAGRADIERMQSESAKELRSDIKLYENAIKEIQDTLNSTDFSKNIEETTAKIEKQKARIEEYKQALANLTPEESANGGAIYYNRRISEAQQKVSQLQKQVNDWGQEQNRLNENLKEYNAQLEAAKRIQNGDNLTGSFKDAAENAKKTAKETQSIGKEAEKSSSKVKGIFGGLKSSFSGLMKGDFSGLFKFVGKIGVWGAGIAAVGKGLFEASKAAEEFRVAMQPLNHYMDASKVQEVSQNILSMTSKTTKSCADMANAALQFAKVWDGLKDAPGALTQMIESSNEYGALTGRTSEEGAKAISQMASEYHMTAQEASEMNNIIASAAKHSTDSFGEMSDAIASAGSTTALYGVTFKETATLIGYSSGQFGNAQKAASKLSMLLMSMSKLQDKYNPSVVGMVTALKNLKDAYERGENIASKFMARNRSVAMYFIKNADAIEQYSKKLENADAKNELLGDLSQRASANLAKLNNAWNGFLTSLNANLTPTLTNILNFFNRIIGGAKQTASQLNYIKNYDKIHPGNNKDVDYTGEVASKWYLSGFPEAQLSARTAASMRMERQKENTKSFNKQEEQLQKIFDRAYRKARDKYKPNPKTGYKGISVEGMFNAGMNAVKKAIKNDPQAFSEFQNAYTYNHFYKEKKRNTLALNQKPNNTNTDLGGGFGGDDKGDEARKYREQLAEQQAKEEARKRKERWDLYVAEEEKGIAKEKDVAEKERLQKKLDFEKKLHQIDEEAEQLKQANIQAAKAKYDNDPQNKKKEGFYASGLDKKVTLTEKQQKIISTKKEVVHAQVREEDEKALKNLTDKYRNENQQRLDIEKKYDADIKKIQEARAKKQEELNKAATEEQKEELQKQINDLVLAEAKATKDKGEAIVSFDFDLLKKNPEYIQAFEDLNNVSNETLTSLIGMFEKFKTKAAESMSPDQIREFTNTLQSMQDALLERKNPFTQVAETAVEYQISNAQVKALEDYIKALKEGKNIEQANVGVSKKLGKTYKNQEEAEKDLAKAKDKRNKAENKHQKAVKNLNAKINELADSINSLGNIIGGTEGQILGIIGGVLSFVTQTTEGIKLVAATGANAISSIEKASVILGIISAAILLLQKIGSMFKDTHAQYEEYAQKLKAVNDLTTAVNEYKLAVIKAQQQEKTWFASTGLIDLRESWTYSQEALQGYLDKLTETQAIYQNESGGGWLTNSLKWVGSAVGKIVSLPGELVKKGLEALGVDMNNWLGDLTKGVVNFATGGFAAIFGAGIGKMIDDSNKYDKGTTAAYNNLRIETRKKSSGFLGSGIGGHKQKTKDLREWTKQKFGKDLFDENYMIDVDLAKTILDKYGNKLVGETKETLEELIKFKEEYDKFNEQLHEYVSELYSPLVDNFTDALFDWFDNGKDVMDSFKQYATSTFREIAKEMIKSMVITEIFNKYKDQLSNIYMAYISGAMSEEQFINSMTGVVGSLTEDLEKGIPAAQKTLTALDESLRKAGYDLHEAEQSSQSATGKAIEAVTADQANTLIGIGYAMQISIEQGNTTRESMRSNVETICYYQTQISCDISEIKDIQYQGLNQLQQIVKNTEPIVAINENIASMYKLMKERI